MSSDGISDEVRRKLDLWKSWDRDTWPEWYVWTGGWYELDGENAYYTEWDGLGAGATVFDVGCYEGGWIERMCIRSPEYEYYGFEPSPRAFEVARKKLCGECSVSLYNFGLGSKTEDVPLYDYNRDSATFLDKTLDINTDEMRDKIDAKIKAKIVDISEFMEDEGIPYVDLMAINVEGWEFELLPHIIGSGLVNRIERFMIQWHSVVTDYRAKQYMIMSQLARTHEMKWNLGAWEAWRKRR